MRFGPIVIGYDGSVAAEHAVREAGELLGGRPALVVVVWNQGLGFELLELPTAHDRAAARATGHPDRVRDRRGDARTGATPCTEGR
jgi:hypothetical protein